MKKLHYQIFKFFYLFPLFLLSSCVVDDYPRLPVSEKLETVSIDEAKGLFTHVTTTRTSSRIGSFFKKSSQTLLVVPDWETYDLADIELSQAQLATVKATINVESDLLFKMVFLKEGNSYFGAIEARNPIKEDANGDMMDGDLYYVDFNGVLMGGYKLKDKRITHKINRKVETTQAGFAFMTTLIFQDEGDILWDLGELDDLVVIAYPPRTIINWSFILHDFGDHMIPTENLYDPEDPIAGGGGGSAPKCPPNTGKVLNSNGDCDCPSGKVEDVNGVCVFSDDSNCERAKERTNNNTLQMKVSNLVAKLSEPDETGYQVNQNANGTSYNFVQGTDASTPIPHDADTYGAIHTHWNLYSLPPITDPNNANFGRTPTRNTIKMFSPTDVKWLFSLARKKYDYGRTEWENELDIQQCFVMVVTDLGNYLLQIENVQQMLMGFPRNFDSKDEDMLIRYKKALENDTELGLLNFLDKEFQIKNVGLYKLNENDTTTKIQKTQNGLKIVSPC
ncbi:hypothetical protein [Nonlabens antarcticus]|uniref:hypothetical protein n=1 Tax=Nonlabens antarcticus TaxID=392714 RepID=UPI001891CCCE|nr:hypothetical protein [Nonlabens antarcticus]